MIYAKLAGILLTVIGLFAVGYHFGEMPYKTKYEALQTARWEDKFNAQKVAATAIAGQLSDLQRQIQVNQNAMQTLQSQSDAVVADRDATFGRVRRLEQLLVAASSRRPAGPDSVPKDDSGSAAAGAGGEGSLTEVEQLLVDAKEEAERNADRLDALIAEVTPQVEPK
jgi:hypothetical protein